MASSSFIFSGFLPAPIASTIDGSSPALSASGACAYHSYCDPHACAVMMIAISLTRLSSEVLNRRYSPTFCSRSASSGLRSQALNGPRRPPLGPLMISSATLRCAGDILSSGIGAMRSAVTAAAEPANKTQSSEPRRIEFMVFSLVSARSNAGLPAESVASRRILARQFLAVEQRFICIAPNRMRQLSMAARRCYQAICVRPGIKGRFVNDRFGRPGCGETHRLARRTRRSGRVAARHADGSGGIAHGAINPAHVLLTNDGRIMLTDCVFGAGLEVLQRNREQLWKDFGLAIGLQRSGHRSVLLRPAR